MIKFLMPSLGADMEYGTLVEWRKKPGDELKRGDIIADVDTQKGLIEIEVFDEGVLEEQLVQEGQKVPVGTVLALIRPLIEAGAEESEIPEAIQPIEEREKEIDKPSPVGEKVVVPRDSMPSHPESKRVKISPLAKSMAEANEIDISKLEGTGPAGAIVKADIDGALAKKKMEASTEKVEKEDLAASQKDIAGPSTDAIRQAVAAAMSKSNKEIPHYYLEKRMDMSKAMNWIKEANKERSVQQRLLPVALLIKAVAKALDEVPDLNAVWENGLQRKNEINIGFVVSLRSGGIMVPAILNADMKTIDEIMETLNDIIPRARAFKLRSSELSQSTFIITSIGEGGADKVFGVIYPPQVGIVGFGEIREEPVAEYGLIGIRPVIDVTLAADHRATDGLIGGRFLSAINKYLQNPETYE